MDSLHSRGTVVSRKLDQTTLASSAYISGTKLHDDKRNKTFEFSRAERVIHTEIVLPNGNTMDRQEAWNRVEKKHTRGDARLAYKYLLSIPIELPKASALKLAKDIADNMSNRYGVLVDYAVHMDGKKNPHIHYQASACACDENGIMGKKVIELDPTACKYEQIQNPMQILRPLYTDMVNKEFERLGINKKLEHTTFKERGIDRIPEISEGHGADRAIRKEMNRQIRLYNQEIESKKLDKTLQMAKTETQQAPKTKKAILLDLMQYARSGDILAIKQAQAVAKEIKDELIEKVKVKVQEQRQEELLKAKTLKIEEEKKVEAWKDANPYPIYKEPIFGKEKAFAEFQKDVAIWQKEETKTSALYQKLYHQIENMEGYDIDSLAKSEFERTPKLEEFRQVSRELDKLSQDYHKNLDKENDKDLGKGYER